MHRFVRIVIMVWGFPCLKESYCSNHDVDFPCLGVKESVSKMHCS